MVAKNFAETRLRAAAAAPSWPRAAGSAAAATWSWWCRATTTPRAASTASAGPGRRPCVAASTYQSSAAPSLELPARAVEDRRGRRGAGRRRARRSAHRHCRGQIDTRRQRVQVLDALHCSQDGVRGWPPGGAPRATSSAGPLGSPAAPTSCTRVGAGGRVPAPRSEHRHRSRKVSSGSEQMQTGGSPDADGVAGLAGGARHARRRPRPGRGRHRLGDGRDHVRRGHVRAVRRFRVALRIKGETADEFAGLGRRDARARPPVTSTGGRWTSSAPAATAPTPSTSRRWPRW